LPDQVLDSLPTPFVKLTDFGLSRFVAPSDPLLTTRCGSEEYAAPELLMGKPYDGRKTDAWAFGVCAYAVLTGVLPFVDPGQAYEAASFNGSALSSSGNSSRGRRSYLMKIAKGEFAWPGSAGGSGQSPTSPLSPMSRAVQEAAGEQSQHLITPGARALVGRYLERDPEKRARVDEVWGMDWMDGEGRLSEAERGEGRLRVRGPQERNEGADALEEVWVRA